MKSPQRYSQELENKEKKNTRWIDSFAAASSDGLIALDEKLRVRFVNPTASKIYGREGSEIIGSSIQSLGYLGAILSPIVSKVIKTKEIVFESFEVPNDEDVLIYEASFNPAFNEEGDIQGVFGILRDITTRHKLAEELRLSKKRLETQSRALEVFDIVSETDLTGRLVYVNDRFCELTGYSREELLGKDYRLIKSDYHSKAFFRRLWKTISRGEVWTGEIKNKSKSGEHFWVQTIIAPLLDDDGKLDRFLSVQRDVTRIHEKRERNEEFARRFNQILQNSHSMIISTDLRGDIVFANKPFLEATGYDDRDILGKHWIDHFIPPDQRKEVQRLWLEALANRKETRFEANVISVSGQTREVMWYLSPARNQEGEVFAMTLVGEDVTEKKSTQEAMTSLEQEVHTKTQNVLSFVSHQLKNGLISIDAGLEMIGEELLASDLNKERVHELISKIKGRVKDLESFSLELLQNFAHERTAFRIRLQPFSLKSFVMGIFERVRTDNRDKPIEFLIDLPRQDIIVNWDMLKVDELLTNLFSNAIKYLKPGGGKIELRVRRIHDNILMTVKDNGIGIPHDSLESLFEWFSRGKISHSKKRSGFGVGLRFCKEVVGRHGGRIWLESKVDEGTSFHCLLPQDPKQKKI